MNDSETPDASAPAGCGSAQAAGPGGRLAWVGSSEQAEPLDARAELAAESARAAEDPRPLLEVRRLGRIEYAQAHALQQELVEQRIAGAIGDQLLLAEHEDVLTVGRGAPRAAAGAAQLPIFEVERGGEATWHGPGQLVVYPLLALEESRRDLHRYLRDLEEVVIRMLAELGVEARRNPPHTGVWVGARKLCSMGVAVRRWVTWHGFALNLRADLAQFRSFAPCGLEGSVMANLADFTELPPTFLLLEVLAVKHVCEVFGRRLPPVPLPRAPESAGGDPRFPQLPILPG